jgi:hypothetical protein
MSMPSSGPMPPPQPYPGMYYARMPLDNFLTRRNVFVLNAFGLLFMWIGFLIGLYANPTDSGMHSFARLLIITFGFLGVIGSVAGALGSKKTSDSQSLGLLVWAGLLLIGAILLNSLF